MSVFTAQKKRLILPVAAVLAVLAALVGTNLYTRMTIEAKYKEQAALYEQASASLALSVLQEELRGIGELATVEYHYTDVGKFSDPKQFFGYDVPFTTKSFLLKWDGTLKAGVDLTQTDIRVDDLQGTLTVTLPPAKILSHAVDDGSFETLDEKNNLFNPIKVEDVGKVVQESKAFTEQRAIEKGLLDQAYANAEAMLRDLFLVNPALRDNYTIQFRSSSGS